MRGDCGSKEAQQRLGKEIMGTGGGLAWFWGLFFYSQRSIVLEI
jgi:hypothetical protein